MPSRSLAQPTLPTLTIHSSDTPPPPPPPPPHYQHMASKRQDAEPEGCLPCHSRTRRTPFLCRPCTPVGPTQGKKGRAHVSVTFGRTLRGMWLNEQ
eukprot:1234143-Rhodomonas_salina.2